MKLRRRTVDRIEVEHAREHVDRSLQQRGRFGPARAAVGPGRRRVGERDPRVELDRGDAVRARRHEARHHRDERAPDRIRTDVGDAAHTQARRSCRRARAPISTSCTCPRPCVMLQQVLVPGLDPRDRHAEPLRQRGDQQLLDVHAALRTEPAADRRRPHRRPASSSSPSAPAISRRTPNTDCVLAHTDDAVHLRARRRSRSAPSAPGATRWLTNRARTTTSASAQPAPRSAG